MRPGFLILLACLAGCGQGEVAQFDSTIETHVSPVTTLPRGVPGDVPSYVEAKARYRLAYEAANSPGDTLPDDAKGAMQDLEARTRAIVGPMWSSGAPWKFNVAMIETSGNMGGEELDGLRTDVGSTIIVVSTPELASAWLQYRKFSATDYRAGLSTQRAQTNAFGLEAAAEQFADIRTKATLPPDVFFAGMMAYAQDSGTPDPSHVVVGLDRGPHVYLIRAPIVVRIAPPESCGSPYRDTGYHACYDSTVAAHSDFAKIVAQVHALRSMVPDK